MEKIQLGESGLPVTPIGLGLAALGRPGYINIGHGRDLQGHREVEALEAQAHTVLDAAWNGGVRYFDAARSYGRAEAFLGSWLRQRRISPSDITIGSKWGYTYTAGWRVNLPEGKEHEVKEHSIAVLERQIRESRAELGGYLDLYQIHSATLKSGVLENEAVLFELARLRDEGLAIGFTTSGPRQPETIWKALEIQRSGKPLFATVQATWNLLERSATKALSAAHEAGMGVIVKEALANGRLTPRNDAPNFQEKRRLLEALAEERGTTMDALALAAVLQQPFVDMVLSGAANASQLESNLGALKLFWDAEREEALDTLVEPAEEYWKTRSNLPWN